MVKLDIEATLKYTEAELKAKAAEKLRMPVCEVGEIRIIKRALSLEDKNNIYYKMTVATAFSPEREAGLLKMRKTRLKIL